MADAYKNFAYTTVTTAPSPATSGTSMTVADGTVLPAVPFNATVWVTGANPLNSNAEIVRVTNRVGNDLTILRAQEGSTARAIVVGDQFAATITAKSLADVDLSISDGTNTQGSGVVRLSNANGVSFGLNAGTLTASHNGLTTARASNDAIGLNTALTANGLSVTANSSGLSINVPAWLTTAALSNHSHGNPQLNLTNLSGTTASNSAGFTLSLSAAAGGGGADGYNVLAAGTQTATTAGTVLFENSNGVTFGMSGSTRITASHNGLTSQSNQALSGSNGSFAFQTATFGNLNGVSFYTSNGSLVASHNGLTTARASNDGIGLATAQSNVTWTVNSDGLSLDGRGYAGTGTTFNGANISGSVTLNSVGVNLSLSVAPGGGGADGYNMIAAGTQTAATTGTVLFQNSNGITFGMSNSSVVTASHNGLTQQSTQPVAASAANGSFAFSTLSFSNLNGISFGTSAGSAITASHNGLTTARASNDAVGLNTALTAGPLAWTVNSSGISLNAGSAAGTTSGFAGNLISGSMTHNTAGLNLSLSHPAWLTTAMASNAVTLSNIRVSAGTTSNLLSALTFNDANGISFGLNASTLTASHNGLTSQSNQNVTAANGGFAFQTLSFSNLNGISFGTSAGSAITASHNGLTTARASNDGIGLGTAQTNVTWTVNSGGLSLNAAGYAGTGTTFAGANISASMTLNSNGLNLSASVAAGGGGGVTPVASASNGSFSFTTLAFSNANNVTFGTSAGSIITASVAAPGAAAENNAINLLGANTAGNTTATGSTIGWSGQNVTLSGTNGSQVVISAPATSSLSATGILSISTDGSTISIGAPRTVLSVWEPFPVITGSAYSSHGPASFWVNRFVLDDPISVSRVNAVLSFNAAVPGATSQASTGTARYSYSRGFSIFTRQDYSVNSTRLSFLTSGSIGITAGVSYSSTSQSFVMSWITDTTGGVSTTNTTSNAGGWSSFVTGPKLVPIPFVTSLSHGEYFIAWRHSSTTGTTQSNVTLMSVSALHIAPQLVTVGVLGGNGTVASSGIDGVGFGVASALTTNNTMAASVVSVATKNIIYHNYSNA